MTTTDTPSTASKVSGYAPVDGLDVYYEVHGGAPNAVTTPIVLLPGGLLAIETEWEADILPRFSRNRPVIAIEPQGHGHTADRESDYQLGQLAGDTAGVLEHLGVKKAHLFGHSMGGMIAFETALQRPDLVETLTVLGITSNLDGMLEELAVLQRDPTHQPSAELIPLLPTEEHFASWRDNFTRVNPKPETFDEVVTKLNVLLTNWTGWTEDQLRSIRVPTLVAIGDNDFTRIEHAAEMYRLIPNAKLAVLPGTTHISISERGAWLEPMLEELFETDAAPAA
jgi:pimeloyl-ACP methyl ester carboxylesterase